EDEPMAAAPHRGHAAKDHGHKARQIGEGDQHVQTPLQRREGENSQRWHAASPLHLSALICKGWTVYGVDSEYVSALGTCPAPMYRSSSLLSPKKIGRSIARASPKKTTPPLLCKSLAMKSLST